MKTVLLLSLIILSLSCSRKEAGFNQSEFSEAIDAYFKNHVSEFKTLDSIKYVAVDAVTDKSLVELEALEYYVPMGQDLQRFYKNNDSTYFFSALEYKKKMEGIKWKKEGKDSVIVRYYQVNFKALYTKEDMTMGILRGDIFFDPIKNRLVESSQLIPGSEGNIRETEYDKDFWDL